MQIRRIVITASVLLIVGGCNKSPPDAAPAESSPEFAGSLACQNCHTSEYDHWKDSHHALAMQVANDDTILGDFSGISFDYFDTTTHFVKQNGEFVVRTEDAQGEIEDFPVTHTFGVEPLQQYLVDFPGGRKQALPFAWDTRSSGSGGQRWYHLYPDEYIGPDNPLHWTGRYFNWNYMCAECHSTNVDLDYDIEADSFNTTFSEISVGCEACHGRGSSHIRQAQRGSFDETFGLVLSLDDRAGATWITNPDTGIAERSDSAVQMQQVESCGRCHSRRSVLAGEYEYGKPLTDTHMPSLLEENLYYADGKIQDEVYVYGSFVQSKMYAAGVTCSDCHNPHSGQLRAGPNPNDTCARCHLPTKFATAAHSEEATGDCVGCHMPATTYMGVDDRRDHSFRLPNAGQSESHYGPAIAAGRAAPANRHLITALANPGHPAIARATMITLLTPPLSEEELTVLAAELDSPDSLVRIAALRSLRQQPAEARLRYGSHLLRDPVRGVRVEAALTCAELRDLLPIEDARAFEKAADEYRAAMHTAASMPAAVTNLAEFESTTGNTAAADEYFKHAIDLDASFAPARHAYGLFLVRTGQSDDALEQLRKAANQAPENSRYAYVLGVALNSLGHSSEALAQLGKARRNFPDDFDIAWALATMLRDSGNISAARSMAIEMRQQFPLNRNVEALISALEPNK